MNAHAYVRRRRAIQALVACAWVALPLTGLVQMDLGHLRLVLAGHAWPPVGADLLPAAALRRGAPPRWDLVAPALLALVLPVVLAALAFLATARTFGRVHCGYSCVYGFLAESGERLMRWAGDRPARRLAVRLGIALAGPLAAFPIVSLFTTPRGLLHGLATGNPVIVVPYAVLSVIAALMGAFVRLRFCRYVCGVGLVQSVAWSTNAKALEVGFHAAPAADHGGMRDCTGCHGCRDVCPIGFDPRQPKRFMLACFQCGLCVERCEDELAPRGKGPAIGFHLADPTYPLPAQVAPRVPDLIAMARARQASADSRP